jgi:hypothetical protein
MRDYTSSISLVLRLLKSCHLHSRFYFAALQNVDITKDSSSCIKKNKQLGRCDEFEEELPSPPPKSVRYRTNSDAKCHASFVSLPTLAKKKVKKP